MKRLWTVYLLTLVAAVIAMSQGAPAESAALPAGLTEIEDEAFYGNTNLTAAVLPDGLESIGSRAFADTGLREVYLPSSLEEIADDAFDGPDKVSVTAEENSYAYLWAVSNGYIVPPFTWAENSGGSITITGYTGDDAELVIPGKIQGKTVTGIGEGVFRDNTVLTRVTLPDTLTKIGAEAFYGCAGLKRPDLPFGLKEIGDRAFSGPTGNSLRIPRTVVSIGEDAFTGFRYMNVCPGSYGYQWAETMLELNSSLILIPAYASLAYASAEVAFEDDQVTCTARLTDPYTESLQWQRCFDNFDWVDCEGEGTDGEVWTFTASGETCGCLYRVATTDPSGTYYSQAVHVGYLPGDFHISSAYVSGTDISLGWDSGWDGITYTLYMTGPDGTELAVAEGISEGFYDIAGLEPETAYAFRLKAAYGDRSVESVPVTVTTQDYRTGAVYRALLIGQVHYGYEEILDSSGDLNLMGSMLQHVTGPQGGAYSISRKTDLTADQVRQAIRTTFADADADDVSLFFIACHGVENDTEDAGALACYNPDTRKDEYIRDTTLAEWLSEVPGEVVVILEACSSGSAVQEPDEDPDEASDEENPSGNSVSPAAMNAAVVSAFQSQDQTLQTGGVRYGFDEEGNAVQLPPLLRVGGLRRSKFHVLTSSAHLESSYAYPEPGFPHTLFTYGLTQAVGLSGRMPCDTDGDGLASLSELAAYVSGFRDPYLGDQYKQHVQTYPAGSSYALFMRGAPSGD